MKFISERVQDTFQFAEKLAQRLTGGEMILIDGQLGAGKTVFAKGLAKGLGITAPIVSPTFTIMNAYAGRLNLYHYDAYRLSSGEEAVCAGLDEYFGTKDGVCLIEWYSNIADILNHYKTIKIKLVYKSENQREIIIDDEQTES